MKTHKEIITDIDTIVGLNNEVTDNTHMDLVDDISDYIWEKIKDELTDYTDFLLKNGYCDSDVYCEGNSAIDRYMHPKLNK